MVTASNASLFATDGQDTWRLICDCFGCLLLRHPTAPANSANADVRIPDAGVVQWGVGRATLPDFAAVVSSFACDGTTLAVTLTNSHHVYLLARAAQWEGEAPAEPARLGDPGSAGASPSRNAGDAP